MKAQAGIEFITLVSILLVLLSIFLYSSYSKQAEMLSIRIENDLKDLIKSAAFEINAAVRAGDGYERTFNFNVYTNLKGYNITIIKNTIFLEYGSWNLQHNIVTDAVIGNFTDGYNTIKNVGGIVYVN
ncbi:MAG: hypothetical protein N3D75_03280 [Candidatus Aenigmarchaeota archaeon]|nr:hypothetical protein [Candidatus Aenigmarchaeota archaeon]